jgi:hypothetical protein
MITECAGKAMPEVEEAPKTGGTRGFFLVRMGDPVMD